MNVRSGLLVVLRTFFGFVNGSSMRCVSHGSTKQFVATCAGTPPAHLLYAELPGLAHPASVVGKGRKEGSHRATKKKKKNRFGILPTLRSC
ncbi:hypothetical protein BJV78DRAFT_206040 [Lactifluus subvellereus]|nr:hypothetical protein BJV78DRAFT_206040 [Lactifluus subvellereus]